MTLKLKELKEKLIELLYFNKYDEKQLFQIKEDKKFGHIITTGIYNPKAEYFIIGINDLMKNNDDRMKIVHFYFEDDYLFDIYFNLKFRKKIIERLKKDDVLAIIETDFSIYEETSEEIIFMNSLNKKLTKNLSENSNKPILPNIRPAKDDVLRNWQIQFYPNEVNSASINLQHNFSGKKIQQMLNVYFNSIVDMKVKNLIIFLFGKSEIKKSSKFLEKLKSRNIKFTLIPTRMGVVQLYKKRKKEKILKRKINLSSSSSTTT